MITGSSDLIRGKTARDHERRPGMSHFTLRCRRPNGRTARDRGRPPAELGARQHPHNGRTRGTPVPVELAQSDRAGAGGWPPRALASPAGWPG